MHSGFTALRGACPMNLYTGWANYVRPARGSGRSRPDRCDLVARARPFGRAVPLRDYTLADAFYAPVATRIATYDLSVSETAQAYVRTHLEQPDFRRWRAMGLAEGPELKQYDMPLHARPSRPSRRSPHAPSRPAPRKTPRAPIPANRSRISPRSAAASSASATPSAATRPWWTPSLARLHGNLRFVNASRVAVNHV
jgi:hypothetical protein